MTRILLRNATLIDGTGATPVPSAALLIDGATISWAGAEKELPTTAGEAPTRVDLAGNTICPGFFDCHVHVGLPGAGGLPLDRILHPTSYHYHQLIERLRVTLHNTPTSTCRRGST